MSSKPAAINDHLSSRRRHIYGFGALIALALMLIGITLNAFHTDQMRKTAQGWQVHSVQVLLTAAQVRSSTNQLLRGARGYLITSDTSYLDTYHQGARTARKFAAELRELTQDNPAQRANVAALDARLKRYLDVVQRIVSLHREGQGEAAAAIVKRGTDRAQIEDLLAIIDRVDHEERRLLTERNAANNNAAFKSEVADIALAAVALVFLLVVGWAGLSASRARNQTLKLEEALRRAATTDDLTGLLNRRAFLAALDTEISRSARSGSPLALALIDLDLFKSVNDRFGHAGGDEVLRRFADTARETMRAGDVIGRLGGEEFAVLMTDTDMVQSGIAGERLREAVARRRVVLSTGALAPVTISVGVAHYHAGEERDRLIIRADEALYEAKDSGRNRTRLAA